MSIVDPLLAELEQESAATLRLLERIPEDKLTWRPHAKSMSLGQLALHLARVPGALTQAAQLDGIQVPEFKNSEAESRQQIVDAFRESLATAKEGWSKLSDARLMENWSVSNGEQVVMSLPRVAVLRALILNHSYHHRGQLTVYLRMLDVPLSSVYGPSADENPFQ
jgi:uncharacterized damage-inducible protein DinB